MTIDTSKVADSNTSAATARKPGKLGAAATWADDRLGLATGMRKQIRKVFPDHWSFMLGEIALELRGAAPHRHLPHAVVQAQHG
jgi:ubiquinol-cytochrome c reductase cytochrome b subunit